MLSLAALLAACSIAGAFWVGVLAARRIRDFGEGQRALERARRPLALAASAGQEVAVERVREALARRLVDEGLLEDVAAGTAPPRPVKEHLGPFDLRRGDVVSIDAAEPDVDGDFIASWTLLLREGPQRRMVVGLEDGLDRRVLVAVEGDPDLLVLTPVDDHDLVGEPPRQIVRDGASLSLSRRGHAAVAGTGPHGRPDASRMAYYVYEGADGRVGFVERWGRRVFLAIGHRIPGHTVTFLPAS
ncbi:MAG: DUF4178 domain-containing protein [Deltaproteobacteria bacterium]|nr:MAG: DUF4178 domain-containing protein [Deltaproteobacteria bacterium]